MFVILIHVDRFEAEAADLSKHDMKAGSDLVDYRTVESKRVHDIFHDN